MWILGSTAALACSCILLAQPQSVPPSQETKDPIVRITVDLVQVDAVVTDAHGRHISNLTPNDFEILEDGRPRKITNFSYIKTGETAAATEPKTMAGKNGRPFPVPTTGLDPETVRRTIVLVVDDLGMSWESTVYARQAVMKFIGEQMRDGDLVAIIRTSGGSGSLQQFSADRRMLYAAAERIRWNPNGIGNVSAFTPLRPDPAKSDSKLTEDQNATGSNPPGIRTPIGDFQRDIFTAGTLGALEYIVRGVRNLPGRKSVILFSDGISLFYRGEANTRLLDAIHNLVDLANRSAVVIYTLDARGLQTLGFGGADYTNTASGRAVRLDLANIRQARHDVNFNAQTGLIYLARETGGLFFGDNNDLNLGIRRVLEDQQGYYLIGYKPDVTSFELEKGHRRYHKIRVRVKGAGLQVRSRTGFLGIPDQERTPVYTTRNQQLDAAFHSPFFSGGIRVRLSCFFSLLPDSGPVVRTLLHLDARDLTFTEEEGKRKSVADIVAIAFGSEGQVIDQTDRVFTFHLSPEQYDEAARSGFVYTLDVPIKNPGVFQIRTVVRDDATGKIGSASQFMEVPDTPRGALALSSIVLQADESQFKQGIFGKYEQIGDAAGSIAGAGTPAVRTFKAASKMLYNYSIFNAQAGPQDGKQDVETQIHVYREGREVLTGPVVPFKGVIANASHSVAVSGGIRLTKLEPGDYLLQIAVTDRLSKQKDPVTYQWTDFQVVP